MKVKLRKVGNSYTLTLPGELVSDLGLSEGAAMDVTVQEDRVIYQPVTDTWDALRDRLRRQAQVQGVTENDVDRAVNEARSALGRK